MKIASLLAVLALVLGTTFLTGCGDKDDAGAAHKTMEHMQSPSTSQPAGKPSASAAGNCPVTGHPVKADAGTVTINNKTYGVCCPACIDKIKAAPQKFLKM